MTRFLHAASAWMGDINATIALACLVLALSLWGMWRPSTPAPDSWACEHQTNTAGKDVIIRHRDAAFCPIPADVAEQSFTDTDL